MDFDDVLGRFGPQSLPTGPQMSGDIPESAFDAPHVVRRAIVRLAHLIADDYDDPKRLALAAELLLDGLGQLDSDGVAEAVASSLSNAPEPARMIAQHWAQQRPEEGASAASIVAQRYNAAASAMKAADSATYRHHGADTTVESLLETGSGRAYRETQDGRGDHRYDGLDWSWLDRVASAPLSVLAPKLVDGTIALLTDAMMLEQADPYDDDALDPVGLWSAWCDASAAVRLRVAPVAVDGVRDALGYEREMPDRLDGNELLPRAWHLLTPLTILNAAGVSDTDARTSDVLRWLLRDLAYLAGVFDIGSTYGVVPLDLSAWLLASNPASVPRSDAPIAPPDYGKATELPNGFGAPGPKTQSVQPVAGFVFRRAYLHAVSHIMRPDAPPEHACGIDWMAANMAMCGMLHHALTDNVSGPGYLVFAMEQVQQIPVQLSGPIQAWAAEHAKSNTKEQTALAVAFVSALHGPRAAAYMLAGAKRDAQDAAWALSNEASALSHEDDYTSVFQVLVRNVWEVAEHVGTAVVQDPESAGTDKLIRGGRALFDAWKELADSRQAAVAYEAWYAAEMVALVGVGQDRGPADFQRTGIAHAAQALACFAGRVCGQEGPLTLDFANALDEQTAKDPWAITIAEMGELASHPSPMHIVERIEAAAALFRGNPNDPRSDQLPSYWSDALRQLAKLTGQSRVSMTLQARRGTLRDNAALMAACEAAP